MATNKMIRGPMHRGSGLRQSAGHAVPSFSIPAGEKALRVTVDATDGTICAAEVMITTVPTFAHNVPEETCVLDGAAGKATYQFLVPLRVQSVTNPTSETFQLVCSTFVMLDIFKDKATFDIQAHNTITRSAAAASGFSMALALAAFAYSVTDDVTAGTITQAALNLAQACVCCNIHVDAAFEEKLYKDSVAVPDYAVLFKSRCNFNTRLAAILYIMRKACDRGLTKISLDLPALNETVDITKNVSHPAISHPSLFNAVATGDRPAEVFLENLDVCLGAMMQKGCERIKTILGKLKTSADFTAYSTDSMCISAFDIMDKTLEDMTAFGGAVNVTATALSIRAMDIADVVVRHMDAMKSFMIEQPVERTVIDDSTVVVPAVSGLALKNVCDGRRRSFMVQGKAFYAAFVTGESVHLVGDAPFRVIVVNASAAAPDVHGTPVFRIKRGQTVVNVPCSGTSVFKNSAPTKSKRMLLVSAIREAEPLALTLLSDAEATSAVEEPTVLDSISSAMASVTMHGSPATRPLERHVGVPTSAGGAGQGSSRSHRIQHPAPLSSLPRFGATGLADLDALKEGSVQCIICYSTKASFFKDKRGVSKCTVELGFTTSKRHNITFDGLPPTAYTYMPVTVAGSTIRNEVRKFNAAKHRRTLKQVNLTGEFDAPVVLRAVFEGLSAETLSEATHLCSITITAP